MARQTELDKLQIAWTKLQAVINATLPALTARASSVHSKATGGASSGRRQL